MKRNGDKDIVAKNYFCVDIDVRENHKKINDETITDDAMAGVLEHIITLSEDTLFDNRRRIIHSGNGYHFYFT